MTRHATASRAPANRSAVSNGSRILTGVNGCSALARRYRDLVEALTDEIPGDLGEAERLHVRNAASLQLHAEELTARLVRGEVVDPEAITRATNGATRALTALRKRARPTPRATDVRAYLAAKGAA